MVHDTCRPPLSGLSLVMGHFLFENRPMNDFQKRKHWYMALADSLLWGAVSFLKIDLREGHWWYMTLADPLLRVAVASFKIDK